MSDPRYEAIRVALEAERTRLQDELADLSAAVPEQMTYGSQAAAATQVFEQQRDLALRDRTRHQLEQIEAALTRIEQGAFGRCQRCGNHIPAERLEAIPWAAYCIDCQRLVQHGR
jgi:RNA polymerase-binding protein DksA